MIQPQEQSSSISPTRVEPMPIRRPCINCNQLTERITRCDTCQQHHDHLYNSDYRRQAKIIRQTATSCWLCGEGARDHDPWQADHVLPGDSRSPLRAAHRSCNIRRSNSGRGGVASNFFGLEHGG
jgi:hypothetical protein